MRGGTMKHFSQPDIGQKPGRHGECAANPRELTNSKARGFLPGRSANAPEVATTRIGMENTMHKTVKRIAFAAIAISVCSSWTAAQPQSPADPGCPAGYGSMGSLCFNSATGDVVNASAPVASRVASELGCRPEYWRVGALCFNSSTGDVELADEGEPPAGQRAAERN
jgi:hypothetical protein